MNRILGWVVALVLVLVMVLNIALGLQNMRLREQVARAGAQPAGAPASREQATTVAQLEQRLERSEQDRIKATRDAASLREQLGRVQASAQENEALKRQIQALQQENEQLRNQVGNLQAMNEINGQVVKVRGLAPLAGVPREFMSRDQLRAYLTREMEQELSPEAEQRQRAILRALDMDSGDTDLRKAQIDTLSKNILGFYRHDTKRLVVVTDRPLMGVGDRVTYAHEFTHSLQDQHYNLGALFDRAAGNSDYAEAIRALVEGDATLSMSLYARTNLSAMDIASYQLEQVQTMDLSGFLDASGPLTESAAAFPYTDGTAFVSVLYQQGGWAEVARAFANPPRSSEQVLHPARFFAGDEPAQVRLPDLAAALGGWRALAEDTLGELYLRIYLERSLPADLAADVAAGWGGDRYQVLGDGGGRLALALQTAWDSPNEAREFFDAYGAFVVALAGGTPAVLQAEPARMRWQLAGRQIYLSRVANRVLVLHAPDGPALDALLRQFPGL